MRDYLEKVINRADDLGLLVDKRINHLIDLTYANKAFNIDWKSWYESDDMNFIHDFIGIYKNIDRDKIQSTDKYSECFNLFVPRFSNIF